MMMIDGHTLFPHEADWSTRPTWKRRWQTGIESSLTGVENRGAFRALPLHEVSFTLTSSSLQSRNRLDARIDQALKSGLACMPFYGKGTTVAATGANSVTVASLSPWNYSAGDYIILISDDLIFDALQVVDVAGNVLTLAVNLANAWGAGTIIRPLLFGKFTVGKMTLFNSWHVSFPCSVAQLFAERNAQLGNVNPPAGVGAQVVGRTNNVI